MTPFVSGTNPPNKHYLLGLATGEAADEKNILDKDDFRRLCG